MQWQSLSLNLKNLDILMEKLFDKNRLNQDMGTQSVILLTNFWIWSYIEENSNLTSQYFHQMMKSKTIKKRMRKVV